MRVVSVWAVLVFSLAQAPPSPFGFRLIRSVSGPTGHEAGWRFIIAEPRNRFSVPPDNSVVVYFEWEGPLGKHRLEGIWRRPGGGAAAITPIEMDVREPRFGAYWSNPLDPRMEEGVWTLEVRINGQPAGSHDFEIQIARGESGAAPALSPARRALNMEELFALRSSLVWIHKQDSRGRSFDVSSGFVIRPGRIATAFQSVDGASSAVVEFHDGRKVQTRHALAWNRLEDWAILEADTGATAPLPLARPGGVAVGDRLIAFNVESERVRVIGSVDAAGREDRQPFGARLLFNPPLSLQAAGSPLLNVYGEVVAIAGGSLLPGFRPSLDQAFSRFTANNAATPIHLLPQNADGAAGAVFERLFERGEFTAPVEFEPNLLVAGTSREPAGSLRTGVPREQSDFRQSDASVTVFAIWMEREKRKGPLAVTASLHDLDNRSRAAAKPVKLKLSSRESVRTLFSFTPAALPAGQYRVDVELNGKPVWRTKIQISE